MFKDEQKKRIFKKVTVIVLIVTTIILGIIQIIKIIPKKELISTKTYDIYELTLEENQIYYSYIDENQKINQDYFNEDFIQNIIYLNEKKQVTVEYWGYNGKISKVELIKFHIDEETYKELSKKYEWHYNMDFY